MYMVLYVSLVQHKASGVGKANTESLARRWRKKDTAIQENSIEIPNLVAKKSPLS